MRVNPRKPRREDVNRGPHDFPVIPADKLDKHIGRPVHLAWAGRGHVWILESIDGDEVNLRTPKTKRPLRALAADVCYTRRPSAR